MANLIDTVKGLFKRRGHMGWDVPQGEQVPAYSTPPFNPNAPIPLGGHPAPQFIDLEEQISENDQHLKRYRSDVEGTLARLNGPGPKMISDEPDLAEVGASLIGQLFGGQGSRQKYIDAPFTIARDRADRGNALAIKNAELAQNAQKTILGGQIDLIGKATDRADLLAKLKVDMANKQIAQSAKQATQAAKADQAFRLKLADMLGKGQATQQGIAALLVGMGQDPQIAMQSAGEILQSVQTDPSFQVQLQADKLQFDEDKLAADTQNKNFKQWRDTAHNPQAGVQQRYAALVSLAENGDPYYSRLAPEQLLAVAKELSPVDEKNQAQTAKTKADTQMVKAKLPYAAREALAKAKLTERQANLMAKRVMSFDEEFQARTAERWARVSKLTEDPKSSSKETLSALSGLRSIYQAQIDQLETKETASFYKDGVVFAPEDQQRLDDLRADMEGIEASYQALLAPEEPPLFDTGKAMGAFPGVPVPVLQGMGEIKPPQQAKKQKPKNKPKPQKKTFTSPGGTTYTFDTP